mmetsp:Transcript_20309/g.52005  ORF Transcript_20309/g.52005 Transcript_20309/m.52005 type:complete len:185 (-) Transcript_20309:66-620(-)
MAEAGPANEHYSGSASGVHVLSSTQFSTLPVIKVTMCVVQNVEKEGATRTAFSFRVVEHDQETGTKRLFGVFVEEVAATVSIAEAFFISARRGLEEALAEGAQRVHVLSEMPGIFSDIFDVTNSASHNLAALRSLLTGARVSVCGRQKVLEGKPALSGEGLLHAVFGKAEDSVLLKLRELAVAR